MIRIAPPDSGRSNKRDDPYNQAERQGRYSQGNQYSGDPSTRKGRASTFGPASSRSADRAWTREQPKFPGSERNLSPGRRIVVATFRLRPWEADKRSDEAAMRSQ